MQRHLSGREMLLMDYFAGCKTDREVRIKIANLNRTEIAVLTYYLLEQGLLDNTIWDEFEEPGGD